jgi:hypothetical protein
MKKTLISIMLIVVIAIAFGMSHQIAYAAPGCRIVGGCLWPFTCKPMGFCDATPHSCSAGAWECGCCVVRDEGYVICRCNF